MALRGNTRNLRRLNQMLAGVSVELARRVARRGAIVLTVGLRRSFDSGETVYGAARPLGEHGPLSLVRSGTTSRMLMFQQLDTKIRCRIGAFYAKYLIGRYAILPSGNAALPEEWNQALARVVKHVGDAYFAEGGE